MLTNYQKEVIIKLMKKAHCGIVIAYWSLRYWEYDEELAYIFIIEENI